MNLLLIAPPRIGLLNGLPHGLIAIANYIKRNSTEHECVILDFGIFTDEKAHHEFIKYLSKPHQFDCVCFSVTSATYQSCISMAKIVKKINNNLSVIVGGPHPSYQDKVILENHPEIDCVIRGEGEKPVLEILNQGGEEIQWNLIPSATFRKNGRIIRNLKSEELSEAELGNIPFEMNDIKISSVYGRNSRISYVTSRGCPNKCKFCVAGQKQFRSKPAQRIIEDLKYIQKEGYTRIAIEDDNFLFVFERVKQLCDSMQELQEKGIDWDCQTGLETITNQALIENLCRSSCSKIYFGLENFDEKCLQFLAKTVWSDKYISNFVSIQLPWLLKSNLRVSLNLQVGIPVEDKVSYEINLKYLELIGSMAAKVGKAIEICPMLHILYPGTIEYEEFRLKLNFPDEIFELYTVWEMENEQYKNLLSKNFAHGNGGIPIGILKQNLLCIPIFELDVKKLSDIVDYIDSMRELDGLVLAEYTKYLTNSIQPNKEHI